VSEHAAPGAAASAAEPGPLSPREKAAVLHRIRMLMEFWGITPEELEAEGPAPPPDPAPAAPPTVKYRHPRSGETWDGCGAHPQWLRDALLKEGFTVEQLRAAAQSPD
jgi:DNA-binding protein H-NS